MSGYEYSSRGENIKPIYRENYYVYDRGVSNHSSFSCKSNADTAFNSYP